MPNKFFGEASFVDGDGRTLTLRYDFNALAEAEDALPPGRTIAEVQKDAAAGRERLKDARALLWGALRAHHPEITPEEAGAMLVTSEGRASEALKTAAMAAHDIPESAEGNATRRRKPAPGTGTRSSRRGAKRG